MIRKRSALLGWFGSLLTLIASTTTGLSEEASTLMFRKAPIEVVASVYGDLTDKAVSVEEGVYACISLSPQKKLSATENATIIEAVLKRANIEFIPVTSNCFSVAWIDPAKAPPRTRRSPDASTRQSGAGEQFPSQDGLEQHLRSFQKELMNRPKREQAEEPQLGRLSPKPTPDRRTVKELEDRVAELKGSCSPYPGMRYSNVQAVYGPFNPISEPPFNGSGTIPHCLSIKPLYSRLETVTIILQVTYKNNEVVESEYILPDVNLNEETVLKDTVLVRKHPDRKELLLDAIEWMEQVSDYLARRAAQAAATKAYQQNRKRS